MSASPGLRSNADRRAAARAYVRSRTVHVVGWSGQMEILPFLAGVILLALGFWDVFETIVVPRPTPSRLRLTRHIVPRTWRLWRAIGERRQGVARDLFLGLYAPAAAVLLLATWILTLVLGYALVLYAIRDQLE